MTAETGYRHIVRVPSVYGGRPTIEGTRIPVTIIVGCYKQGLSVEEIVRDYPNLTPAQVYQALSYYHDHQDQIEHEIEKDRVENVLKRRGFTVTSDGRIMKEKTA